MSSPSWQCYPIDAPDMLAQIIQARRDALPLVGCDEQAEPARIVEGINQLLLGLTGDSSPGLPGGTEGRVEQLDPDGAEGLALKLGCLWGDQLVRGLGWHWIKVHLPESGFLIAVAATDLSLVIYPFLFVMQCLERQQPVTISQSFTVLSTPGRVPPLPANALENVMDHIHLEG